METQVYYHSICFYTFLEHNFVFLCKVQGVQCVKNLAFTKRTLLTHVYKFQKVPCFTVKWLVGLILDLT